MSSDERSSEPGDVLGYFAALSNWDRWGRDDLLGTLNYIGQAQRKAAISLAVDGTAVSCARVIRADANGTTAGQSLRFMAKGGESAPEHGWGEASEWIGFRYHGRTITHLDGLEHVFWDGYSYNGRSANEVTTEHGAIRGSTETLPNGSIIARGVLLDVPRSLGVDYVEPGVGVTPEQVLACERSEGIEIGPGDAIFIRTGLDEVERQHGGPYPGGRLAGVAPQCLPLLYERQIALLGGDGVNDARPAPPKGTKVSLPVHAVGIVAMGLWLLDNAYLEDLAQYCAQRGRWTFTLVVAALKIQGATGSPVNPIAIF